MSPFGNYRREGEIHLERASQLRIIGLMESALEEAEAARQIAPTSPKAALEIARIYRDLGQPNRAVQPCSAPILTILLTKVTKSAVKRGKFSFPYVNGKPSSRQPSQWA